MPPFRPPLATRRDPVPPAPDAPGGYLRIEQPNLFWRSWDVLQGATLLARVRRAGWRRYSVETQAAREETRFRGRVLALGPLAATPARGGAAIGGATLAYRTREIPYPTLADHEGPLALFGDFRGSGFSATSEVWTADRLLARGGNAVWTIVLALLVLRERPGSFR